MDLIADSEKSSRVIGVAELNRLAKELIEQQSAVDVGGGRDLELHARGVRALLFLAEGRAGAGALRDVPAQGAIARLEAGKRHAGRSSRDAFVLRGARRISVERRNDAPRGARRALCRVREAEGQAAGGRPVRRGDETGAAAFSARDRHRHFAAGRGAARRADDAQAPHAVHPGRHLSDARAGRGRGREDRGGHCDCRCARRMRRADRVPRRRQHRGFVGIQRRSGGARDPRLRVARGQRRRP